MKRTKYIFVTGGVVSGLGKGITAASLGRLLKARGLKVAAQKLDPYINVDPGTMSPYQHGEVYVTEDGGKHYEQVEFAHKTYTDSIGNIVAPYDYPKMPYEKDGVIYVLCGQGADGDYDGGDSLHLARYRSEDYGHSFVFDTLVDGTSEG